MATVDSSLTPSPSLAPAPAQANSEKDTPGLRPDDSNSNSTRQQQQGVRAKTDMGYPGEGPWHYTRLREPYLSQELERMSAPRVYTFGGGTSTSTSTGGNEGMATTGTGTGQSQSQDKDKSTLPPRRAYSVSLQPCLHPDQASQDRIVVENWKMPDGEWVFTGVFDGHAGHDTVDYTLSQLPTLIRTALEKTFKSNLDASLSPEFTKSISMLLRDSITQLDQSLTDALLKLFPNVNTIAEMTNAEIQELIRDTDEDEDEEGPGRNARTVARCMRGSTVLVALTDARRANLWVASLGDCVAVLGSENGSQVRVVSSTHNGQVQSEANRVREEHPGEDEAILRNRVLGALAVTRAIGDHLFKLPALYTTRVFSNAAAGFRISTPLQDIIPRIKTPPYVSSVPDITHVTLRPGETTTNNNNNNSDKLRNFVILASDGLVELFHHGVDARVWVSYVREALLASSASSSAPPPTPTSASAATSASTQAVAGTSSTSPPVGKTKKERNPALALLRRGLGGESEEHVSRMLTVEMAERWMDDTSIVVLTL